MLGLIVAGALITIYEPPVAWGNDDSLAVVIGNAANIIATLLVIAVASLGAIVLAGISFLRKEPVWPAAIGICLAVPALIVVIVAVTNL